MSDAKWCDQGQHAFSSPDENAQTLTITINKHDVYGRLIPASLTKDICGECATGIKALMSGSTPDDTAARELESAKADAEMWRAKYEASAVHNGGTI